MSENEIGLDESIFDDDIDVDAIPDNPNHLPEDTYLCRITKAVLKLTAKKDKIGLTLTYQITEGKYAVMFPFTEWLWCPRKPKDAGPDFEWSPEEIRANSRLKKHFEAAGFGADEYRKTKPSELIGKYILVRTKNKKDSDDMERVNVAGVLSPDAENYDNMGSTGDKSGFADDPDF